MGSARGGVRRAAPGAGGSGHCGLRAGRCRLPALAALPAPHHPLTSDESGVQPSSPLPLPWRRRLGPASSPREVLPACPHGNPADGAKPGVGSRSQAVPTVGGQVTQTTGSVVCHEPVGGQCRPDGLASWASFRLPPASRSIWEGASRPPSALAGLGRGPTCFPEPRHGQTRPLSRR